MFQIKIEWLMTLIFFINDGVATRYRKTHAMPAHLKNVKNWKQDTAKEAYTEGEIVTAEKSPNNFSLLVCRFFLK